MDRTHSTRFEKRAVLVGYQTRFAAIRASGHLNEHQLRSQLDSNMPEIASQGVVEDYLQRLINRAMIGASAGMGFQENAAVPCYRQLLAGIGAASCIAEVGLIQQAS